MKQALILSGGQGTRAKSRIGNKPKSLIEIDNKPILWYQLELLKKYNYTQVLILVNHLADQIIEYINSNQDWGINIKVIDEEVPMGTAGAVINCMSLLEDNFLVMYGDTMLDVNLSYFERFHDLDLNTSVSLFVHPNDHPFDSDLIEVNDDNTVTAFHKYPHNNEYFYPNLVNAALYYIKKSCLMHWNDKVSKLDFGKDIFPFLLENNFIIKAYNSPEYIKDTGTPERIDEVNQDLKSGYINNCGFQLQQPCIFLDRDGSLNKEVGYLKDATNFQLFPNTINGIKKINKSKYRAIVITNQPVIARGECSVDNLLKIHNKMETKLGAQGAYLDRIYYCPHHPDSGFDGEIPSLKFECKCRKPAIGMIEKAASDFNIDLNESWLLGDSTVDILTAKNAGVKSILLETGYAGLDQRFNVLPDYTLPDLDAAINFILSENFYLQTVCEKNSRNVKPGDFVFISGLSRVGKTNLSSTLKYHLLEKNHNAIVLSLDRWLLSEDKRGKGVLKRYALNELEELIRLLSDRGEETIINVPFYNKVTKKRISNYEKISIMDSDIIIFEGTVALSLSNLVSCKKSISWYIELNEEVRRKRFFNEYKLRRFENNQIEMIYNERELDEHKLIRNSLDIADLKITLKG